MDTFIAAFGAFLLVTLFLGLGRLFGRGPLRGSCGGPECRCVERCEAGRTETLSGEDP